jgi:zona occludens toxin (predicted ATPase)
VIIAYTGLPGGGKSLSSIPDFLLPALREGRAVFSNIAGLEPMAIAAWLGVNTPRVNRLLRRFSMSFRDNAAEQDRVFFRRLDDGSAHYSNAEGLSLLLGEVCAAEGDPLVVFDECHEYFNPRNFAQLEPFLKYLSMARHDCHDILLITQHVRDIWEPLLNRVHETHTFERGRFGLRSQYIHRRFAGVNIMASPVAVQSRVNDRSIYGLYASHRKKGAKERLGYGVSIFRSRKLLFMAALAFYFIVSSAWSFFSGGGVFGPAQKASAESRGSPSAPAPEAAADANVIYVKYVVCGAWDCKATRPDGTVIALPLDYASGRYPLEVRKYAPGPASLVPSFPNAPQRPK